MLELMKQRHSVRSYIDKPLDEESVRILREEILKWNKEADLNMQLYINEKDAFSGLLAHYGKFKGVKNYIAMVGPKTKDLDEKIGYYGGHLVLKAQELGLNTCWVGLTFNKRKSHHVVNEGEKLVCVIALGYGETQGVSHKSKSIEDLCVVYDEMPEWFYNGMQAVMLAPTALNQQRFQFTYNGECVEAKAFPAFYSKVDLGIAKYHFEIGANQNIKWKS